MYLNYLKVGERGSISSQGGDGGPNGSGGGGGVGPERSDGDGCVLAVDEGGEDRWQGGVGWRVGWVGAIERADRCVVGW